MLLLHALTIGVLSAQGVFASPTVSTSGKTCFDVTIPVTINYTSYIWGLPQFQNQYDVASFNAALNNRSIGTPAASFNPIIGSQPAVGSYNIAGTYCQPSNGNVQTVLLATHGITLDRCYWDSTYQSATYSFVDAVVAKGYSVFFYDRLGAGKSSKVSGYLNQGTLQVAVLERLVNYIRAGKLTSAAKPSPKNIVLIGHSYGSIIVNGFLSTYPNLVVGAILTGWAYTFSAGLIIAAFQPRIANQLHPQEYAEYDTGYVVPVDIYAGAQLFYQQGNFEVGAAEYLFKRAQPFGILEIMSLGTLTFSAPNVTAPVMFLTGEYDSIVCEGYCPDTFQATTSAMFPKSVGFEANIHPGSGHMINFNHNATGAYQVITNFLAKHNF